MNLTRLGTASNTTKVAAGVARRWHDAREKCKDKLIQAEGVKTFEGLPAFCTVYGRLWKKNGCCASYTAARKEL
jgi:hypothetical protein